MTAIRERLRADKPRHRQERSGEIRPGGSAGRAGKTERYRPGGGDAFEGEIREFVRRDVSFRRKPRNEGEPAQADPVTDNLNSLIRRVSGASMGAVSDVPRSSPIPARHRATCAIHGDRGRPGPRAACATPREDEPVPNAANFSPSIARTRAGSANSDCR